MLIAETNMQEMAISEFKAKCLAVLEQVRANEDSRSGSRALASLWLRWFHRPRWKIAQQWIGSIKEHIRRLLGDIVSPANDEDEWEVLARLRLLLDTHIWLWSVQEPRRLGRRVQRHLQDLQNELWLSPISTCEALTLHYKGKIRIQEDLGTWLARATAGTREAPLTHEIARRSPAACRCIRIPPTAFSRPRLRFWT